MPSEDKLMSRWQECAQEIGQNMAVGAVVCGVASLVLFSRRTVRIAFTTFGAGVGTGVAISGGNRCVKAPARVQGGNSPFSKFAAASGSGCPLRKGQNKPAISDEDHELPTSEVYEQPE
ncbi:MAG: hypothetical protein MHM6MM_003907 [Cercozoa sp. M6MM]